MEKLKELNEKEKIEIVKKLWESDSMQKYVLDKYDFFKTEDNLILELEKVKKIEIKKVLYYDDEFEVPEITLENFINFNKGNMPFRNLDNYLEMKKQLNEQGFTSGRYDYNGIYFQNNNINLDFMVMINFQDEKDKYFKRYLTEEEEKELIELAKERQKQFLERLTKYFKRYSKNICACGYWANR